MERLKITLIAVIAIYSLCYGYIIADMNGDIHKIYVQKFLENETYNTIVLETGLSNDRDIVREYFRNRSYYDQITQEVNYN